MFKTKKIEKTNFNCQNAKVIIIIIIYIIKYTIICFKQK